MKRRILIISILYGLSFPVFSQKITVEQERQIRNKIKEYCTLLSAYSRDIGVGADNIFELFGTDGGQNPVINDLQTPMKITALSTYLAYLSSSDGLANKVHIDFPENIDKIEIKQIERKLPSINEKSVKQNYYAVFITKEFSGAKSGTVRNRISINPQTLELQKVLLDNSDIANNANNDMEEEEFRYAWQFVEAGLEYYNAKPKQYEKAFACFRKAAEMRDIFHDANKDAQYYLAVMLLKKQGCKHIPKNVRKAEAAFWLKKLYESSSSLSSKAEDILLAFGVNFGKHTGHSIDYRNYRDEAIVPYNEGLIKIWKGDKVGFANESGKIVIPCKYQKASEFNDGLVAVCYCSRYGDYGPCFGYSKFLDNNNREIDFKYDVYHPFYENLAAVYSDSEKKYGFINRAGEVIIPFDYEDAGSFSNGLAPVEKDGKWGYISPSNQVVIPFKYDKAGDFVDVSPRLKYENIKFAMVELGKRFFKLGSDGKIYFELNKRVWFRGDYMERYEIRWYQFRDRYIPEYLQLESGNWNEIEQK